jgi:tetratricopeptide (TPR) repeat protein
MKGKLESNPADVGVWLALAHLYDLLGRQEESLAASEEAARRVPNSPETLIALAEALERRNDLTRLSTIIDQLAASGARDDRLLVLRAQLAFRGGDYEGSLALAQSASSSGDAGTRAQLIAQSLDRLGDAKLAYRWFAEMNAEDAKSGAFTDEIAEQARVSLLEDRNILSEEWVASWQPVPPGAAAPIFLVGFPRSGTTLLDTFLMGHPALAVAEEEPMLAKVGEKIGSVDSLPNLHTDQVEELRSIYFQEAARHVGDLRTRTLLDKNPFAMGSQAIIHRIFPLARIIFMERHPCDVVLSCFMTRFQPTGLGANFLTLTNTALLYDAMMSLWERSVEVLKPNLHYVRYERLVDNPEGELRPLSRFLGLEWLPDLLDHMATARSRPFIKTPSYSQVTEPVNARPVGRWVRYREEIEAVLPVLEPWVRKLGYEL